MAISAVVIKVDKSHKLAFTAVISVVGCNYKHWVISWSHFDHKSYDVVTTYVLHIQQSQSNTSISLEPSGCLKNVEWFSRMLNVLFFLASQWCTFVLSRCHTVLFIAPLQCYRQTAMCSQENLKNGLKVIKSFLEVAANSFHIPITGSWKTVLRLVQSDYHSW